MITSEMRTPANDLGLGKKTININGEIILDSDVQMLLRFQVVAKKKVGLLRAYF